MDALAEGAGAFAVDDADVEDAPEAALVEVFGDELADFDGAEGVEVEFPGDGVLVGCVGLVRHGRGGGGCRVSWRR